MPVMEVRAHPRSRGENWWRPVARGLRAGSSPLTRGKRRAPARHPRRRGLIPAHAGKTCDAFTYSTVVGAHPRSRGENAAERPRGDVIGGSSPLTRGKRRSVSFDLRTRGLIPAHAGKTCTASVKRSATRAHPRSRGENRNYPNYRPRSLGSSPLTRGKRASHPHCPCRPGLIPAHAGKTTGSPPGSKTPAAHPRSRGENVLVG